MKISKRDWAQLSAYLDGELNQRDLTRIQNRIEENPEFQVALEDLRNVKKVLSHTPQLSIPKNFTLKHSLVENPRHTSPVRGYSLAAAALSFLFIGVVVLDIGSGTLKGDLSAAQAPRAEEVMLEAAADEMEEPAPLAKEVAVEEEIAPAAEQESDAEAPEFYESGEEGELVGMAEGETNVVPEETDRASSGGEDTAGEEPLDVQNTPSPSEEPAYEEAPSAPDPDIQIRETPDIPWLLILEITFGLGAIGFAGAAWRNRRKKS